MRDFYKYRKIYFSSTTSFPVEYYGVFGLIENAMSKGGRFKKLKESDLIWCLDTGTFNKPFVFSEWWNRFIQYDKLLDTCLFIVVPDKPFDYKTTLQRFFKYEKYIRLSGFPTAFVTQDGISSSEIPWDYFDVLFIGGSDEHKLGKDIFKIIDEGKKQGKWIHVGRVNSVKRLEMFSMCDSWDGTKLSFDPAVATRFYNKVLQLRMREKN